MIVFLHPNHRRHDPGEPHRFGGKLLPPAEIADRADRILAGLTASGGFEIREPALIERSLLEEVHDPGYLTFLETAHSRWRDITGGAGGDEAVAYIRPIPGTAWREPTSVLAQMGRYSNDVDPILDGTWEAALSAASSAAAAARLVADGEPTAYALTRPPGHHAGPETYGGYCFVNNAAIATELLLATGRRVAILDVDTHHGNGTQTIFWDRPEVLTVSIHGDPTEHFPFFIGYADETGGSRAEGANLNLPLATGATWDRYEEVLHTATSAITVHGPDALVVALGVDTEASHGVVGLEGSDYSRLGEAIAGIGAPTVFVQEGGYEPGVLERDVPAVLTAFANAS